MTSKRRGGSGTAQPPTAQASSRRGGSGTAQPPSWPPPGWPRLKPEDRISSYIDQSELVEDFAQLVAEEGEERAREAIDYFVYFLQTSDALLDEREFKDLDWQLDPHDYLVYELLDYVQKEEDQSEEALIVALGSPHVLHMIEDGLRRYYTPDMRRDLARRARRYVRRQGRNVLAVQAEAVATATEDRKINPALIGLLVADLRQALLTAMLDLADLLDREWEERDRRLDPLLEALQEADFEHPAGEAVARLQDAGARALPLLAHLYYDTNYDCDDYAFRAALEVASAIPGHRSLWFLRDSLVECPALSGWIGEHLAAQMPELACDYFRYLLTDPLPANAYLAARGLWTLVAARCADAFDLAVEGLGYRSTQVADTEEVQAAAWQALLALGDARAIPTLRSYLGDAQASPAARDRLVEALQRGEGHPWREEILQPAAP